MKILQIFQRKAPLVFKGKLFQLPCPLIIHLTNMNKDMVYATFYQLMVEPDKYIRKTLCSDGLYYTGQNEKTGTYYHYSIIKDALACCSQGLEFVWGDVLHVYSDEYPKDETEIEVKGTFETYKEPGDDTLYCHLVNSEMQVK